MDLPELIILDVGHGSCALVKGTDNAIIIDCPSGSILMTTIRYLKIREIDCIFISHADYDHIGGITNLLLSQEVKVHHIFLNADAVRSTDAWQDLRFALKDARKRAGTHVHVGLTTVQSKQFRIGQVEIEVLAPTPEMAMSGTGGKDLQGNRLDSNAMSAVFGLVHESVRVALFTGDIEAVGLKNLLEEHDDLGADILVFPHHGGKPGNADGMEFAKLLCDHVQPKLILFSIDRNLFGNPKEEVIRGVKAAVPAAHIMCTQLSKKCALHLPTPDFSHLSNLPAKGRAANSCCCGTILFQIKGPNTLEIPQVARHKAFVHSKVATPMCLLLGARKPLPG